MLLQQFPDTRPDDFDFQFNLAKEKEKEVIEAELATARKQAAQAGENSSVFKVTEGADGAAEYSVGEFHYSFLVTKFVSLYLPYINLNH